MTRFVSAEMMTNRRIILRYSTASEVSVPIFKALPLYYIYVTFVVDFVISMILTDLHLSVKSAGYSLFLAHNIIGTFLQLEIGSISFYPAHTRTVTDTKRRPQECPL